MSKYKNNVIFLKLCNNWKSAKVFALHKGGSPSDINNYRPISVLSVCSKIIERHIHNSFSSYLRDNSLLIDSQSGFMFHMFVKND